MDMPNVSEFIWESDELYYLIFTFLNVHKKPQVLQNDAPSYKNIT